MNDSFDIDRANITKWFRHALMCYHLAKEQGYPYSANMQLERLNYYSELAEALDPQI